MTIEIIQADYSHPQHRAHIVQLLNEYAQDPMGGGTPLDDKVKETLVDGLAEFGKAFTVLAYQDGKPVGLTNCIIGFSSFAAKQLVNIHDIYVAAEQRGLGLSHQMLAFVEDTARKLDCCKVTLEVLSNNQAAKTSYEKFGFAAYQLDPGAGPAQFWQKYL